MVTMEKEGQPIDKQDLAKPKKDFEGQSWKNGLLGIKSLNHVTSPTNFPLTSATEIKCLL